MDKPPFVLYNCQTSIHFRVWEPGVSRIRLLYRWSCCLPWFDVSPVKCLHPPENAEGDSLFCDADGVWVGRHGGERRLHVRAGKRLRAAVRSGQVGCNILSAFLIKSQPSYCRYLMVAVGLLSFLAQILLTISLQLEEAGKISVMRKAGDILFAFLFQITIFHVSSCLLARQMNDC